MPVKSLEAGVRQEPGIAIVDLHGEIDALAEAALNAAFAQAISPAPAAVLLNFSAVDYINSTGIALIVALLAQARSRGFRLLAYGLSDHYVEIFKITRLADYLTVCANESDALREAGSDRR